MTATSSMQRLWLMTLCLLAATLLELRLKADDGKAERDVPDHVHRVAAIHRDALSTTENRIHEWMAPIFFDPAHLSELRATRERLKRIHESFFKSKSPSALPPAMAGGRDLPLPSMMDMIRRFQQQDEFRSISLSGPVPTNVLWEYLPDTCRPTAADLPCFATGYGKAVTKVSALYERWKNHSATRLADSLRRVDDPGFFTVIEWEMARSKR